MGKHKYASGDRVVFDTHGMDSSHNSLSGERGKVERPHRQATPLQADSDSDSVEEVGPMYWINLDNGERISAFEDELTAADD